MKQSILKALGLSLTIVGAFGLGMWFMYFIMWFDVYTNHLLPMVERVFK